MEAGDCRPIIIVLPATVGNQVQKLITQLTAGLLEQNTANASDTQIIDGRQVVQPWERVPDRLWDRQALRMWYSGHSSAEIGQRLGITEKSVFNRLSVLRHRYGSEVVPFASQRQRREVLG